ncbi:MAG: hypothetical protein APR63_06535 [Desulfuromonas sp. SDB]|nr:MAG: hypothetical protein APR63_06535 [Desulfuromonas sp. SDB]
MRKNPDRINFQSSQLVQLLEKIDQANSEVDYPEKLFNHPRIKQLYLNIVRLDSEISLRRAHDQDLLNLQEEINKNIQELKSIPQFSGFLNKQRKLARHWKKFNSLIMGE